MKPFDLPEGTEEDESVFRASLSGAAKVWNKKGRKFLWHRLRGPALIYETGEEVWYRDGIRYTPTAHEKMMWELRKKNECS